MKLYAVKQPTIYHSAPHTVTIGYFLHLENAVNCIKDCLTSSWSEIVDRTLNQNRGCTSNASFTVHFEKNNDGNRITGFEYFYNPTNAAQKMVEEQLFESLKNGQTWYVDSDTGYYIETIVTED